MPTTATTRILHSATNADHFNPRRTWIWPLPRLDGVTPCILRAPASPSTDGVKIGYHGRSLSSGRVPVFAAQDGIITYAGTANRGSVLCLDHSEGWSTQYSELEHLLARPTDRFRRRRKERVRAGDIIGHARRAPLQIRFSLSRLHGGECVILDPATWMPEWSFLPWFESESRIPRSLSDTARSL